MLRYRDLVVFYFLSFLFLGLIPILALIFNNGNMDFSVAAENASHLTNTIWTSNLINVLRLSVVEPILLLTLIGSAAPALAAIVTLAHLHSNKFWSAFFRRLLPYQGCSHADAFKAYMVVFLILVPCLFFIFEVRNSMGGEYASQVNFSLALIPSILAIAFLDQGALLEELGWRGFAAPELQNIGFNPFAAAIMIGICWGLWHLPRDITTGVYERLGMISYLLLYLPSFLLGTVAVSIIAVYFSNRLGGSVIPAIVVHGVTNDALGISGAASIVEALTPFHQITKNLPLAIIALTIVLISGTQLGFCKDGKANT